MLAMEHAEDGSTFNVDGGDEATMNETIAVLERIAGPRIDLRHSASVAGDQLRTKADTTRIREALGWAPRTSLEQGLRAQWEWALREAGETTREIESPA